MPEATRPSLPDGIEVVAAGGRTYAEIIRAHTTVESTRFFSPPESSFQFGLLAHGAGYRESPHYHRETARRIDDLQQMFVIQRGIVEVDLFDDDAHPFRTVRLEPGDAIVLVHGAHAIRAIEDFQALSVKQGPFLGEEEDKMPIDVETPL